MQVKEIMSTPVVTVREDATLEEIAKLMLEHRIACVLVVNDLDVVIGIVTESDFTAKEKHFPFTRFSVPQLFGQYLDEGEVDPIYYAARNISAAEIMTKRVISVTEDEMVRVVLEQLLHHHLNHIPVLRDGRPVGIVARHDLLKMMLEHKIEVPSDGKEPA